MKRLLSAARLAIACSVLTLPLLCQNAWMNDREVMQTLRAEGVQYDRDSATLYFEKDALSPQQMDAFSDLVNQGIKNIEKLLKVPEENSRGRTSKISYFVSSQIDIGRSRARSVFLPLWRVQRGVAPYLHETTHALVRCRDCPMWFSEGFASWVQSYISENVGGYDARVFAKRGNRGVDAEAVRWLGTPNGQAVLPFVIEGGEPPDIVAERRAVGAPFYVLAQSLVKYLVEQAGIDPICALSQTNDFNTRLETAAGKAPEEIKKEWLAVLRSDQITGGSGF